jgi:hypothetical protein
VSRRALSLVEVVLGALVISVSAIPVIELIRASTASLEVTEIEAAARALGADTLERLAGPAVFGHRLWPAVADNAEVPAQVMLESDPVLARGYPRETLGPLLARHHTTLSVSLERDLSHPAWGDRKGMDRYRVRVRWLGLDDNAREVALVRLFARR